MDSESVSANTIETQDLWESRSFIDGFNSVREGKPIARCCPSELTVARCIELASLPKLYIDHWIELSGIGVGRGNSHNISAEEITFIKWTEEEIAGFPPVQEAEIRFRNRTAPNLRFPCSPSELLWFVDNHLGILDCFMVPDAFRLPVTNAEPIAAIPFSATDDDTALPVVEIAPAFLGASEKGEPVVPVGTPATANITVSKLRKNSLDVPIEKAIEQAGCLSTAAVFLKLKELALNGEAPFTGLIERDALCYTNDKDDTDRLTKNALDKRLAKRRKQALVAVNRL